MVVVYVAALMALLAGYSWGGAFSLYILAGNLGIAAAALAVALRRSAREAQRTGWQDLPPAGSEMAAVHSRVMEPRQGLKSAPPVASQSLVSLHPSQARQTIDHSGQRHPGRRRRQ